MEITKFPTEIFLFIITLVIRPSDVFKSLTSPRVCQVDLGYFPYRDQIALDNKRNMCLVCKAFLRVVQPLLFKTVHLYGSEDIRAFHSVAKGVGKMVTELSLGYLEKAGTNKVSSVPNMFI